ncbi:hypothetical protein E2C01_047753 [Portunus trituberculatus]|uniref:Uncharacterized protein n=1 Tax=Portunus trituberculatus TaxID=210409 RepID=A0A5B7G1D4_PORTR|nr:hypothetical protein [Portunus trituberculatus]
MCPSNEKVKLLLGVLRTHARTLDQLPAAGVVVVAPYLVTLRWCDSLDAVPSREEDVMVSLAVKWLNRYCVMESF